LVTDTEKCNLDVVGLQEVRLSDKSSLEEGNYLFYQLTNFMEQTPLLRSW